MSLLVARNIATKFMACLKGPRALVKEKTERKDSINEQ